MISGLPLPRHQRAGRLLAGAGVLVATACLTASADGATGNTKRPAETRAASTPRAVPSVARVSARSVRALSVTGRTATSITVNWRLARGTAKTVAVLRDGTRVARTAESTYTLTGLACARQYVIGVKASGTPLVKIDVSTLACPLITTPTPTPPPPPTGGTPTTPPATGDSGTTPPATDGGTGTTPPPVGGGSVPSGSGGSALPARLAQSTGTTFYVATSGLDTNPGTSTAPWRTVGKALATLQAGQTAVVSGGTYSQSLSIARGGTAAAPITIRNAPGESVVIRSTGGEALDLNPGAQYLRFQGLVFEGATGASTTNIYAMNNVHHIEFAACEVRGSARQGFFSERTTSSIHIIGCNFHDNGGSGPTGLDHNIYIEGSNHVVSGNVVRGARNGYGIQIYPSNSGIIVSANTIVDNGRGGIIVGSQDSTTTNGARIIGNILAYNGEAGLMTYWGGAAGTDNIERNNLAFGNSGGGLTGTSITHGTAITGDPLFVNRTAGDFRLAPGSPALGKAEPAYTPAFDMFGTARPSGTGADLGAVES